jgi:hypothetical protein
MTLGSGIFASTLIVVFIFLLWQATKHRKWRAIGKVAASLVGCCLLLGAGIWGWDLYASRPQLQNELDGITLGATQIDVQLRKGKPSSEDAGRTGSDDVSWLFVDDPDRNENYTFVLFSKDKSTHALSVSVICRHASYETLLGFSSYAGESAVLAKFGKPTYTSIRADGLAKAISFKQWRAAFEFEKGKMTAACVSGSGKVRYSDEYDGEKGLRSENSERRS